VSFLFFIASKRDLLTPAFSSTYWFVRLAVHDTRIMRWSPNISKALILSSSRLFNVQLPQPYVIALHANVFSRKGKERHRKLKIGRMEARHTSNP